MKSCVLVSSPKLKVPLLVPSLLYLEPGGGGDKVGKGTQKERLNVK